MRVILQPFLCIAAAAKVIGWPESKLRRGCADGTVPHVRANGKCYVDIPALWEKLDEEQPDVDKENYNVQ